MLKVSFVLDCDECRAIFEQAAATDRTDTAGWWEAAELIRIWAQQSHWHIHANTHLCPDCFADLERHAEYCNR